jgi:hypothetical protein
MEAIETAVIARKKIAIRFLYTLFFLVVLEILKVMIQVIFLFQYIYLFITRGYSDPLRRFSNKVSVFAYKVMRYVTLNENTCPFPFSDFPQETEAPDPEVHFQ